MPGAQDLVKPKVTNKRMGSVTQAEKDLVAAVVMDSPREVSPKQTRALATALRRGPKVIQKLISEARENFQANAKRYVELHMEGVEAAMANGDPKSLDAGLKAAGWALEHLSGEGERIVEKEVAKGPVGPRIMVGINLAGVDQKKLEGVVIQATEIPPSNEPEDSQ